MAMSKRKRRQTIQLVQYALLVLVIAVLALVADWATIQRAFFNLDAASQQFPGIITTALKNTIIYTVLGFLLGLALGLVLALMKLSSVPPYRWIATVYIEFFRGIPALLVFIALGFGVPLAFGIKFDIYSTAAIALGAVGAAYMAETIRAGIQAVPPGQVEAARSLGMSQGRAMITIVIPQAFRIILPPLTNELILLTKDSSLIYLLGLARDQYELTKWGREGLNATGSMTPILLAGLCYLIITLPLGYLSRYLERRTGRKQTRGLEVEA
ncbi:amino acid ABC transporter permease [Amycolatopsis magusensis]|uniref:Polar amino acid transport system permease protein n=1 Tax=Amycolatopsis magusensis TaxID=882444 RepID=A0ABS4PM15_9PSEU|nr:amino acid ABC transporter permease [Amycolatopsis magusensis]MBP2179888.1 polar amino acid transport system permease protein [Amycolatopsis magusensis]MDI5981416.1 amino acid ABC transporter permease [Amycolatopsis magusensis]